MKDCLEKSKISQLQRFELKRFESWISGGSVDLIDLASKAMGTWICMLVCFVSIQIAQAENDGLLALKDGFQDVFWRWHMESVPMEWDDCKRRNASILC